VTAAALPAEVRDLIARHLGSMHHVDVLLLLRGAEPEEWTARRAAAALHAPPERIAVCMEQLAAAGLLAAGAPAPGGAPCRYAPRTAPLRHATDLLATMNNERPVTLIRAVYDRPADPVQSFADAFRLRAKGE